MQFFTLRDLGQTTTNSTIIFLYFSRFPPLTDVALRRNRANTASDSFVLIAGSFLLQFTKLVIGLPKSVMGAAIKITGHPGRRFLAASPLHSRSKSSF